MKNRKGKKSTENRVISIMALCFRVNRETPHSVFCDFSGHVNLLCVRIHLGGWTEGEDPDISYHAYTSGSLMEFGGLSRIRAKLNSLLEKTK